MIKFYTEFRYENFTNFCGFSKTDLNKKNLKKFEITNPVIGCCQSTLKDGDLVSNICCFYDLSKVQSTGGELHASCF